MRWLILLLLALAAPAHAEKVKALKITVLVTNVAGEPWAGRGEWGFAALVEADGKRILYDTGASPDLALANAEAMGIDLSDIEEVVLSHNHRDHTAGLLRMRETLAKKNPKALSIVHVGAGMFEPRWAKNGQDGNHVAAIRRAYEATGGRFVVHDGPVELLSGIWLTAPVPRRHPEKNWMRHAFEVDTPKGRIEDTVSEDGALAIETADGTVVLTGCGHAGVVNISDEARRVTKAPTYAMIGGLHLYQADDPTLQWTSDQLRAAGIRHLLAAHCTGFEATDRLRALAGMNRKTAVVAGVGSTFELGKGISTLSLAR